MGRYMTGSTVWLTGLLGSGKSTIASTLVSRLSADGRRPILLDADEVRAGLNANLGFRREDRAENVRRLGEVAILFDKAGHLTIVASISPYAADRDRVRQRHVEEETNFIECYVSTPLAVCVTRDPKRLYEAALNGTLRHFTGISDPYEVPRTHDVELPTHLQSVEQSVEDIIQALHCTAGDTIRLTDSHA